MAVFKKGIKLNDEQLKEVEGGAILFTGTFNRPSCDILNDETGEVVATVTGNTYWEMNEKVWTVARKCGVSSKELTWAEVEQLRNKNNH